MKRALAALLLLALATSLPGAVQAATPTDNLYRACKAHVARSGGQMYIAWAAGFAHSCIASDQPAASAQKLALDTCNRNKRKAAGKFAKQLTCEITVSGGKTVSAAYAKARKRIPVIPAKITVFDHPSQMLQPSQNGFLRILPQDDAEQRPTGFEFEAVADGLEVCDGLLRTDPPNGKQIFMATCFGSHFTSHTKSSKLVMTQGLGFILPSQLTFKYRGSWVELRF